MWAPGSGCGPSLATSLVRVSLPGHESATVATWKTEDVWTNAYVAPDGRDVVVDLRSVSSGGSPGGATAGEPGYARFVSVDLTGLREPREQVVVENAYGWFTPCGDSKWFCAGSEPGGPYPNLVRARRADLGR